MDVNLQIGKYRLDKRIGEGGFGIVYLGMDTQLQRPVAIKILKDSPMSDSNWVERFQREANLASRLRHPHIVNILDGGQEGGRYYLVMDYLDGQPLSVLLSSDNPSSVSQTVDILSPIADALDYAHGKGVLHRDVKPSNILVDEHNCPVLTDFGLVKRLDDAGGTTTTGVLMGTVEYMAPEQITGQPLTPAVDLYALAVIAFQMLTGQLPFTGVTPFEIQAGHVQKPVPEPRSLRPALPVAINGILLKALNKNPTQRYATGKDFIAALKQVAEQSSQQTVADLTRQAEEKANRLDFDGALTLLNEAQVVIESPDRAALIQEYSRRKERQAKYMHLTSQLTEIQQMIATITTIDPWILNQPVKNQTPIETNSKTSNIPLLELIAILITLVLLVLAENDTILLPFGQFIGFIAFTEILWRHWWRKGAPKAKLVEVKNTKR